VGERAAIERLAAVPFCPTAGLFFFQMPRGGDAHMDREERRGPTAGLFADNPEAKPVSFSLPFLFD
jgi:hypothetical protein